jgi:predicted N-acetyltransferase YhbS
MAEQPQKLLEVKGFTSFLALNGSGIPSRIDIHNAEDQKVLSFALDAMDAMGFATIPKKTDKNAITCLAETLKQKYGGKNCISVPASLVEEFHKEGFRTYPEKPNGAQYDALMVADTHVAQINAKRMADSYKTRFKLDEKQFSTVTDKAMLQGMSAELSQLLLENAEFASRDDKRALYSPAALQERLAQENVKAMAIVDTATGKPVAFIRGVDHEGLGMYVSDLVVATQYRNRSPGTRLMSDALKAVGKDTKHIFLIAGDAKEEQFYSARLGFDSIAQIRDPVLTSTGEFMFGLFPPREILQSIPARLEQIAVTPAAALQITQQRQH